MMFQIENHPRDEDLEFLSESLFAYNCQQSGIHDYQPFAVFLREDDSTIVGGIAGWTRWKWAHIETFWIHERHRGQGNGTKLLVLAENIARERRCEMLDLDTFSFQAPEFYAKHGFERLFTLDGIDNAIQKHFLRKAIPLDLT